LFQLLGSALEPQVELLLLQREERVLQFVRGLGPVVAGFHQKPLVCNARDDARGNRQLHRPEPQRFLGCGLVDAVDLEHDAARLDPRRPEFDRALALAHADFDRLLGDRQVREDPDPDAAGTLHLAGDRAAGRLDLPRRDAFRLGRLEAVLAKVQFRATLGIAVDAPLVGLAEFGLLGLQHFGSAFSVRRGAFAIAVTALATLPLALPLAAFGGAALVGGGIVLEHFTLEDPHLDTDDAIGRPGFGGAVVDVGAQRMQRHAPFAVPLHAGNIGTAQAATHIDPDAAGAHAHRRLHGALHGAAERHAALELLGDALRDEGCIGL